MEQVEGFDILTYKGVEMKVQRLFSTHAFQNEKGQVEFKFFDFEGQCIETEVLSLRKLKKASFGISVVNLKDTTRLVFVSDCYADLIFFTRQFFPKIAFEAASFIVISAGADAKLLKKVFSKIPKKAKVSTVFDTSILGRIMDCKVQHLVQQQACSFRLSKDLIHVIPDNKVKQYSTSIFSFSLRNYCNGIGMKQTVRTFKPKLKLIESFYQLNQLSSND